MDEQNEWYLQLMISGILLVIDIEQCYIEKQGDYFVAQVHLTLLDN
jgi:hypothetical protein